MTKADFYRSALLGTVTGVAFFSLVYTVLSVAFGPNESESEAPKSTFTVIEQYKGCDVVQWHSSMLADYKYFLDCSGMMDLSKEIKENETN